MYLYFFKKINEINVLILYVSSKYFNEKFLYIYFFIYFLLSFYNQWFVIKLYS